MHLHNGQLMQKCSHRMRHLLLAGILLSLLHYVHYVFDPLYHKSYRGWVQSPGRQRIPSLPSPRQLLSVRCAAGITLRIAHRILRDASETVELDDATLLQQAFQLLAAPLHAGFHAGH